MASLLLKVRKRMSLTAHRKVRSALEGEYSSVFRGRSMDFDDLRLYVPSDDVKDIDWKATARSGQVLIRRYIAIRKYNILLVVDTGKSMAATAPSGESKRDIAVLAAGVIATVAQKHGDPVGLVAGNSEHIAYLPLKEKRSHIERILQHIDSETTLTASSSDVPMLLDYIRRTIRRRMMLIIISDKLSFANTEEELLRRLDAQHEMLFIAVDDLDPSDPAWEAHELYDIESPTPLPSFIRAQETINRAYADYVHRQWNTTTHLLDRLRISSVRMRSESEVIVQMIRLLEKQKHGR